MVIGDLTHVPAIARATEQSHGGIDGLDRVRTLDEGV
jgi:hypothetical protein